MVRQSVALALVLVLTGGGVALAQQPGGYGTWRRIAAPDDLCMIGPWAGSFDLAITHDRGVEANDEIAHAILIPVGGWNDGAAYVPLTGKVLLWTARADLSSRGMPGPDDFHPYVWDPRNPANVTYNLRSPIIPVVPSGMSSHGDDGPFCVGHAWMLDEDKNLELITAGGADGGQLPDRDGKPETCGSTPTTWFDPRQPRSPWAWREGPDELSSRNPFDGLWYPSLTTYFDGSGSYLGGPWLRPELRPRSTGPHGRGMKVCHDAGLALR